MNDKEKKELVELFLKKDITLEELIKMVEKTAFDKGYDKGYEEGFNEGRIETESKVYSSIRDIRNNLDELEDAII